VRKRELNVRRVKVKADTKPTDTRVRKARSDEARKQHKRELAALQGQLRAAAERQRRELAKLRKKHERTIARENEASAQQQQFARTRYETQYRRDIEDSRVAFETKARTSGKRICNGARRAHRCEVP
jgi:hypothetical protein